MVRHTSCVDVHLILRRGDAILLGQRQNTGFADGAWHMPAGHLEADDPGARAALVREAHEEIGVDIKPHEDTARHVHTMHHYTNEGRLALFFEVTDWDGEVTNQEPTKCARWNWFGLDALPDPMLPYGAEALSHYRSGSGYSERGWR